MPDRMSQRQLMGAALLIGAPILYVASYGPYVVLAEFTRDRPDVPVWVMVGDAVFAPVFWLAMTGPHPADNVVRDYVLWCYEFLVGEPF